MVTTLCTFSAHLSTSTDMSYFLYRLPSFINLKWHQLMLTAVIEACCGSRFSCGNM